MVNNIFRYLLRKHLIEYYRLILVLLYPFGFMYPENPIETVDSNIQLDSVFL
jgi:hypothetical protein